MKSMILFILCAIPIFLVGQVEKIYNENGQIQAINPINEEGVFDGLGFIFYPSGAIEKEIPYVQGEKNGTEKRYYEDGTLKGQLSYSKGRKRGIEQVFFPSGELKMQQKWEEDARQGDVEVYYPSGDIRIYALMKNDTMLFAQYFDSTGKVTTERLSFIEEGLDTIDLPPIRVYLEKGEARVAGQANKVNLVQQRIPRDFVAFSSRDGIITLSGDPQYPLEITPDEDTPDDTFTIYIRIKLHTLAAHSLVRKVVLNVLPKG